MTSTTPRHTTRTPRTSIWSRWLTQNRAYGEAFEHWAHPHTTPR